jgi:heparin binding hemagglutinin HbhA
MTNSRSEDVRNAVNTAVEQLRTPLLAALGAGNLASQAVVDAVSKARERVNEGGEIARKNLEELPSEVTTLREKLDPADLRKLVDDYTESALKLYNKLAETGEQAWDKFLAEPRVKAVFDQIEEVLQTTQDRVGEVSTEAREKVEEALGLAAKRTRAGGAKVAEASGEIADKIEAEKPTAPKAAPKPTAKATPARRSTSSTRRTTASTKKPAGGSTGPGTAK